MPLDILPDKLVVPTRDEIIKKWERDVVLRNPGAQVGEGTLPTIDGRAFTDEILPIYAEAQRQAENGTLAGKSSSELEQEAADIGIAGRLPAVGATGYVVVEASVGGTTIPAGTVCKINDARYQCTATALYLNGQVAPVAGVDVGPDSNLDAGTILEWVSPPLGCGAKTSVFENSDGTGLTGGRDQETDDELTDRIRQAKAEPAVAGNDTQYRDAVLATPSLGIQAAFTYPCIQGPGTTAIVFTMRPTRTGATRIPNNAQITTARAWVTGQMPKDDSSLWCTLSAQAVELSLRVRWNQNASGWIDTSPWPPYAAGQPMTVQASPTPTVNTFAVATAASPPTPQVGQTIALYDTTNFKFIRKRIASVSGSNPWTFTFDTSNAVSDQTYIPATGEVVFPWSDSLDNLVTPICGYFDGIGPGEQKSSFFDEGYRERRSPFSPAFYPSTITNAITTPIFALNIVEDVQVASPTLPLSTTVGTPGVSSKLLELSKIYVYPL